MNWLVKFFQNLKSSSSLVLVGDRSVSDNIFWEEILVPIFGKEFCLNINSSVLKKEKYSKAFVSDKIFYNVNSLNYFSAKSKKTKEFISELTTNEKSQTLFNFTTENRPVLQSLGDYKTIKIKSLKNIVKDMGYSSEKKIYKEIDKDLMNFSKILATQ
jgi:phenylalanyl-tRNA synthetase alpha subunit